MSDENKIKIYNKNAAFKIGQTIYHSRFEDKGKIIKKQPAPKENELIVVKFENEGTKTLIAKKPVKRIKPGDTVEISFTEKLATKKILNRVPKNNPVKIAIGESGFPSELENRLIGLTAGEDKKIKLSPENAYGRYNDELVYHMRVSELQGEQLTIGNEYTIRQRDGSVTQARLIKTENDQSIFDANHPLAGKAVIYDIKIHKIIPAHKGNKQ